MNTKQLIQQNYMKLQEIQGLKVGDKVVIIGKCKGHSRGWDDSWLDEMDCEIGQEGTVEYVDRKQGIFVFTGDAGWSYPWFCLKKV
jgi:hypothetical protein